MSETWEAWKSFAPNTCSRHFPSCLLLPPRPHLQRLLCSAPFVGFDDLAGEFGKSKILRTRQFPPDPLPAPAVSPAHPGALEQHEINNAQD
eukprot:764909-Hanusia_phi.AAC.3